MINAHSVDHVAHLVHHNGERNAAVGHALRIQKDGAEVQPSNAARVLNRVELLVQQIARGFAQGVGVGVAGDQGFVAKLGHIPKAFFVDVAQINGNAQLIAGLDQLNACVFQARARVW